MEHTYIEQFEKEFMDKNTVSGVKFKYLTIQELLKAQKDFLLKALKSTRTETLMECRGLLGEDESVFRLDDYEIMARNEFRYRLRTAIDNLIKKETI